MLSVIKINKMYKYWKEKVGVFFRHFFIVFNTFPEHMIVINAVCDVNEISTLLLPLNLPFIGFFL